MVCRGHSIVVILLMTLDGDQVFVMCLSHVMMKAMLAAHNILGSVLFVACTVIWTINGLKFPNYFQYMANVFYLRTSCFSLIFFPINDHIKQG